MKNTIAALLALIICSGGTAFSQTKDDFINAAYKGDIDIVKAALEIGVDINALAKVKDSDMTALMGATIGGHTEIVRLLIGKGADVNAKNSTGRTALVIAVQLGKAEIAKILIDAKADINAKSGNGNNALLIACSQGSADMVKMILAAKVKVNEARDNSGYSPLMSAAVKGNTEIVKMLLATR
jgi:uncharacterized protein